MRGKAPGELVWFKNALREAFEATIKLQALRDKSNEKGMKAVALCKRLHQDRCASDRALEESKCRVKELETSLSKIACILGRAYCEEQTVTDRLSPRVGQVSSDEIPASVLGQ